VEEVDELMFVVGSRERKNSIRSELVVVVVVVVVCALFWLNPNVVIDDADVRRML